MTQSDIKATRVKIHGRVQGVWYRGWTAQTAKSLQLAGWVRNCADGSVEAVFEGPSVAVNEMVERCRQGPPHALVRSLEAIEEAPGGATSFDVKRSG